MSVQRKLLTCFLLLYGTLYVSFGLFSPLLPAFLAARGIEPEALGVLLGAGTAMRLGSAPLAGRLADVSGAFRLELVLFAFSAAIASLLYLPMHSFWMLALVNLIQAAMLAPLVPLSDALALSWSRARTRSQSGAFEYGWVRGAGSAAFIAGVLAGGLAADSLGLASVLWLTAAGLVTAALSARLAPELANGMNCAARMRGVIGQDWLDLLRNPAFVRVVLAAAFVLGSHAMHDAFAIIRWRNASISPAVSSVLWSEAVAAEVAVFFLLGPWLIGALGRTGAMALATAAAAVRWGVIAQTAEIPALAAVEPLHGLSFALFHLACMRIIADTVPPSLAGTAQALYGTVAVGGATSGFTMAAGWLFARFGPAGFWGMAFLCCVALPVIWSLDRSLAGMKGPAQPRS